MANNESFTEEVKYGNNFYIMEYGLILAMFSSGIIAYSVLFKYIAAASSRYPGIPSLDMLLKNI
jgi:hypothetical protein